MTWATVVVVTLIDQAVERLGQPRRIQSGATVRAVVWGLTLAGLLVALAW
jgi:hypothetical protein